MWIKRAAYLCSYTPTKLFMFLNQRNDHEWIILLCTSSIVTGTCLSPHFQTGVDVRICVVFLLLRISRSKLYLHRTNEALLICWSTCMISWSCKGATCFVELLLERLCHQFFRFLFGWNHFCLELRLMRYSFDHLLQNCSARNWTFCHCFLV